MIVTVTANPSLDRTIEVDQLVRGAVQRVGAVRVDAGGKGVTSPARWRPTGTRPGLCCPPAAPMARC